MLRQYGCTTVSTLSSHANFARKETNTSTWLLPTMLTYDCLSSMPDLQV